MAEPLAARLLRIVFGCYFVVTLVVTGIQLAARYWHAERRLKHDIEAMQQTFSPGITDAMWRFNGDVLRGILSGMKQMPVVVGLKVVDEHGNLVRALGTIQTQDGSIRNVDAQGHFLQVAEAAGLFDPMFSRTFDLVHTEADGERQFIGRWTVYSNQGIVIGQVEDDFIIVLINSVIKTLALWFIFLIVIDRAIGRPLQQLSAFVGALNIDNLRVKPFVLHDRGRHELHLLANMLNLMTGKLRRSVEDNTRLVQDLQDMNTSLQAKMAERTQDLEVLARTDLLTGLFNRRKLDEVVDYEGHRVARYGGALSVIIGDVDDFKSVNDLHGHQVGDRVLVVFGAMLRKDMRVVDTVGRWGGEEFMMICPETKLDAAFALAEHLRRRVEVEEFPVAGHKTCSFGVAELAKGETVGGMLGRADAALYRAKQGGRNRVEKADEGA